MTETVMSSRNPNFSGIYNNNSWCLEEVYNIQSFALLNGKNRSLKKKKTTSAYRCDEEFKLLDLKLNSKSQGQKVKKEDEIIIKSFFKGICGGIYVELGALDGIRYSNSYLFGKGLNWHGILIELYVKFELQKQGLILFRAVLFPPRLIIK